MPLFPGFENIQLFSGSFLSEIAFIVPDILYYTARDSVSPHQVQGIVSKARGSKNLAFYGTKMRQKSVLISCVLNRAKKSSDWLRGEQRPLTVGESSSILIIAKLRAKIHLHSNPPGINTVSSAKTKLER